MRFRHRCFNREELSSPSVGFVAELAETKGFHWQPWGKFCEGLCDRVVRGKKRIAFADAVRRMPGTSGVRDGEYYFFTPSNG
jgi:hypothetical protein